MGGDLAVPAGIVAAGDTHCWPRDVTEATARAKWMQEAPGRTVVAVDAAGACWAPPNPPQPGGCRTYVANAGFMVDPADGGRGIGRLLAEHVLDRARADG